MVDYPVNYQKPSLVEYLVDYIVDTNHTEDWRNIDLGEEIASELDMTAHNFAMTDAEYAQLIVALNDFVEDNLGEAIESEIEVRNKNAKEWEEASNEYLMGV